MPFPTKPSSTSNAKDMNPSPERPVNSAHSGWTRHFLITLSLLIGCVVGLYGIIYLDTLTTYQARKTRFIGRADAPERYLTVNGYGKVTGKNDIAMTTIGYSNVDKDVAQAQAANKRVMNNVMNDLKKLGIAENDLKSDFSIYPEYSYSDKGQELKGYRVTNSVAVKIRDLSKISDVLNLAGKYNANQVSGLSFTIDDAEVLKNQARTKALEDVRMKATMIARSLGVRLIAVTNYSEYEAADYPGYDNMMKNIMPLSAVPSAAPTAIEGGTKDVALNVTVVYQIAQ